MNRKHLIRGLAVAASLVALVGVSVPAPALAKRPSPKKCAKKPSRPGCAATTTTTTVPTTTVVDDARPVVPPDAVNEEEDPTGLIVSPSSQKATGNGEIAVSVTVHNLGPGAPFSIAFNGACAGASVATFNSGLVFTAMPASGPGFTTDYAGCNPGTYPVTVSEIGGTGRTYSADFTVLAP